LLYPSGLLCFNDLNSASVRVLDCGEEGGLVEICDEACGGIGRPSEVNDSHACHHAPASQGYAKALVGSAILQRTSPLIYIDNNSHAQTNSGFRLLESYKLWLHLEEASLRTCHEGQPPTSNSGLHRHPEETCGRSDSPVFLEELLMAPSNRAVPTERP
jgi:hypothetical protein